MMLEVTYIMLKRSECITQPRALLHHLTIKTRWLAKCMCYKGFNADQEAENLFKICQASFQS